MADGGTGGDGFGGAGGIDSPTGQGGAGGGAFFGAAAAAERAQRRRGRRRRRQRRRLGRRRGRRLRRVCGRRWRESLSIWRSGGGGGGGAHGFVGAALPGAAASGGAGGSGGGSTATGYGGGGGAGGYGAVVTGTGSLGTLGSAVTGGRAETGGQPQGGNAGTGGFGLLTPAPRSRSRRRAGRRWWPRGEPQWARRGACGGAGIVGQNLTSHGRGRERRGRSGATPSTSPAAPNTLTFTSNRRPDRSASGARHLRHPASTRLSACSRSRPTTVSTASTGGTRPAAAVGLGAANPSAIALNAGGGTFDTIGFNTTVSQAITGRAD